MSYLQKIEQYLLFGQGDGIGSQHFQAARLGAYAYLHLAERHPAKQELRTDYLVASVRHSQIRDNLIPLITAWSKAGVQIAFLKGFRLAEFEYTRPAERFYGDVDVLILPTSIDTAKRIAESFGWLVLFDENDALWTDSHAAVLRSADNLVSLELHCVVVQSHRVFSKRLSQAFWYSSSLQEWQGTQVRALQPIDVMLCMYLNRAWGDYYGRKFHDILDLQTLIQKYELTCDDLEARAAEFNLLSALKVAMRTCDPWLKKLQLGKRSKLEVWWDALCAFPNWRSFAFDLLLLRLSKIPILIADVFEGWRLVHFAKRVLARESDLNVIVQSMIPTQLAPTGNARVKTLRLERGVRWALRLKNQHIDACVPRSLALFHALRKEGLEVSFVSGVRRNNNKLEGHAWLELHGKPIVGLGDENAPQMFKENFRYPAKPFTEVRHISSDN